MGGYDLYGNWYSRDIDALNAESAQCAEIDAGINRQEQKNQANELEVMKTENSKLLERLKVLEVKLMEGE